MNASLEPAQVRRRVFRRSLVWLLAAGALGAAVGGWSDRGSPDPGGARFGPARMAIIPAGSRTMTDEVLQREIQTRFVGLFSAESLLEVVSRLDLAPEWGLPDDLAAAAQLAEILRIERIPGTNLVTIETNPGHSGDAAALANAFAEAVEERSRNFVPEAEMLRERGFQLAEMEYADALRDMTDIAQASGVDLSPWIAGVNEHAAAGGGVDKPFGNIPRELDMWMARGDVEKAWHALRGVPEPRDGSASEEQGRLERELEEARDKLRVLYAERLQDNERLVVVVQAVERWKLGFRNLEALRESRGRRPSHDTDSVDRVLFVQKAIALPISAHHPARSAGLIRGAAWGLAAGAAVLLLAFLAGVYATRRASV